MRHRKSSAVVSGPRSTPTGFGCRGLLEPQSEFKNSKPLERLIDSVRTSSKSIFRSPFHIFVSPLSTITHIALGHLNRLGPLRNMLKPNDLRAGLGGQIASVEFP